MNLNNLLIEFLERVKNLEIRVAELEEELKNKKNIVSEDQEDQEELEEEKITKTVTRKHVINKIEKNNNGIKAEKGSKAKGSDIILSKNGKKVDISIKMFHSKSYDEKFVRGWNTLHVDEFKYDIYIFCVVFEGKVNTFLFTDKEIKAMISEENVDTNNIAHFYIQINEDGKMVQNRGRATDISKNFENWRLISQMIK